MRSSMKVVVEWAALPFVVFPIDVRTQLLLVLMTTHSDSFRDKEVRQT